MAKTTLTTQLMHANVRIAELEASLATARQCYRELRDSHASRIVANNGHITPIVTRFTKCDGSVWEKTRTGNRASIKQLIAAQPTAAELDEHYADQQAQYRAYHS